MDELTGEKLGAQLRFLAGRERRALAELLRALSELDRRWEAGAPGQPSLFAFCVSELRLSEAAAYRRLYAARAARRWPAIHGMIEAGELSLEGVAILGPKLEQGGLALLEAARGKSLRALREMIGPPPPRSAALRERRARQRSQLSLGL